MFPLQSTHHRQHHRRQQNRRQQQDRRQSQVCNVLMVIVALRIVKAKTKVLAAGVKS